MTFQPVIPIGGFAGWSFLKRTMGSQQAALQAAPTNARDEAYFKANIGKVRTADDLVNDRRLLSVALTAYGLEGDINNKAFIRKVLADGTLSDTALSTRLADKRYQKFSAAFGFGDFSVPRTQLSDFADKTLALFRTRQFEEAVGTQNNAFRLGLNTERELGELAARPTAEDTKWFTILGNAPLRQVFQTALGLPSSFASIDLDKQLVTLKARTKAQFGDAGISQFTDPKKVQNLIRSYLVRNEIAGSDTGLSSSSAALQLLQGLRR
jgi:Protein of unknown function (DUF1217)